MSLRGIDIASWQAGIVPSQTDTDFVIVKATGGTWYENPYFEQWADDVLVSGKLLGIYHYAVESQSDANARAEAEYFLNHVRKYKGKFIPFLDWEADAMDYPQEWAREWMDIVAAETGATPVFYAYASHLNSKDYGLVAEKYPLWMASYLDRYINAGWVEEPRNPWGFGSWDSMLMYQYTSTGYVDGYDRDLDLNVYYGTREDWQRMCGGGISPAKEETRQQVRYLLSRSHMAAEVMYHLVTCPRHGYSQPNRAGDGTWENITLSDGTTVTIRGGDKDCSEAVRLCYEAAGVLGTYWESYTWTGNEHDVLTSAGFIPVSLDDAQVGDVLWREGHTELVIEVDGRLMQAGFRRSETGGKDGETGDQDGLESTYSEYHPWEWERCYRYAGPEREGHEESIIEDWSDAMDMTYIINVKDEHRINPADERTAMLKAGWQVLWTQGGGFKYLEHPDCVKLANENARYFTGKDIPQKDSSSKAPYAFRLYQLTALNAQNTVLKERWPKQ